MARFNRRLGALAEPLETPPTQKPGRSSGVIARSLQIPLTQRRNRRSSVIAEPPIIIVQKLDIMSCMAPEPLESPLSPVVRHFRERNNVKGAINTVRKLPDHSALHLSIWKMRKTQRMQYGKLPD